MIEPQASASRAKTRLAASVTGVALVAVVLGLYAARKMIAREALTGWLKSHGVATEVEIRGLGLNDLGGRVRLGDPHAPDFVAGDAQVAYGFRDWKFEVRSVTLRHPLLRAHLHDGRLSLGTLDPLIEEFRKKPPQPDTLEPRIEIDGGELLLETDYGPVRLTLNAMLKGGRLISLVARSQPARLRGRDFDIVLGRSGASWLTRGDRVGLSLDASLDSLTARDHSALSLRLRLAGEAPYPDLKRKRLDGVVALHVDLAASGLSLGGDHFDAPRLGANFQGRASGGMDDFALYGRVAADLISAAATTDLVGLGPLHMVAKAGDLRWRRYGGDEISATPQMTAQFQDASAGDLRLSRLLVEGGGPTSYGAAGPRAALTARLDTRGQWRGFGAAKVDEASGLSAIRRAAQGFQVSAPAVQLDVAGAALRIGLPQPLRLRTDSGGGLTVSGKPGRPFFGSRRGGNFKVTMQGGGLPVVQANIQGFVVADGAVTAQGAATAAGSFGLVERGTLDVAGVLQIARGRLTFKAERCAPLTAQRLVFGATDVERVSARLCPWDGPMFSLDNGDWSLRAKADAISADAPFLQARTKGGTGSVRADQTAGLLSVSAVFDQALVFDDAHETRFNPLSLGGTAGLVGGRWTGDFKARTSARQPLGDLTLQHDTLDGRGGLTLDSGPVVFIDGGLQPIQLSPLAKALGSPAEGQVRFAGQVDWTPEGATSHGTLAITHLDFQSPAGRVSGLNGEVAFTSLAPLIAPPGQVLRAVSLAAIVPVTRLSAAFNLDGKALTITGGEAAVGGGRVQIESLSLSLAADGAMNGVLAFDGVQLHDLVEASPFGDRVELDAKVSGRTPFRIEAGKVRVAAAELHAIQPGRLSINRQALTGIATTGSVIAPSGSAAPVPPNDAFTDFAYQAMENLAFDKLDATLASRADGRLGVLAHIVGRHDPPKHQEIKLSLFDLIGRKFLKKPLPLPSDTRVDLTLETVLNLDDLLADYDDFLRLRNSGPVQAESSTTQTKPLETPR